MYMVYLVVCFKSNEAIDVPSLLVYIGLDKLMRFIMPQKHLILRLIWKLVIYVKYWQQKSTTILLRVAICSRCCGSLYHSLLIYWTPKIIEHECVLRDHLLMSQWPQWYGLFHCIEKALEIYPVLLTTPVQAWVLSRCLWYRWSSPWRDKTDMPSFDNL